MKKGLFLLLVLMILLSAPLFATGRQDVVEEIEETQFEGVENIDYSQGWEIGKRGGVYVRAELSDPKTFNASVAAETSTTDITARLATPLVQRNQFTLEWEPYGAERWEFSADEKTITLYLRKDMKWSDGTPITAKDYVFTINHVDLREDVESNSRDGLFVDDEPVKVKLINDYTLSITAPVVYAGMLNISNTSPAPMHVFGPLIGWTEADGFDYEWEKDAEGNIVEKKADHIEYAKINSFWGVDVDVTTVLSSGPFVIKEYVPSQKVVLGRNPYFWEKDAKGTQLPYIDELIMLVVEDMDTQLAKFKAGDLDSYGLRGEDYAVLIDLKAEIGFELYNTGPATSTQFITFNQNPNGIEKPAHTWTSNKKFRQAMAHLVDRQTIINNIAYGFGYPQYSFIPRFSPYYWDGVDEAAFKFNPETAKKLLDEIGYVDTDGDGWREDTEGNKITLALNTNSGNTVRENIGELFAQECRKIGIDLSFQPEDFNSLVTKLLSGENWEAILIGLTGSVDPISGANVYPSSGNLHMIEPNQESPRRVWEAEVDAAWKVANNTTDEAQRTRGWETIQRIWADELPWIYTFNAALLGAYKTKFGNIYPQPVNSYGWDGIVHRLYLK
jgi:peptide/nickel transport system substrate-binding protein